MARPRGVPNRNFPAMTLEKALKMPRTLQEGASGMRTDRLTLSQLLDNSPSSSIFVKLVLASRAYGLTTGGKNADEFGLTEIGRSAVSDDPEKRQEGLRRAVLAIDPFRAFLNGYDRKKVPQAAAFKAFLVNQAGVPADHAEEAMGHVLADAQFAGILRNVKGSNWVDLQGAPASTPAIEEESGEVDAEADGEELEQDDVGHAVDGDGDGFRETARRPKAIFIGHGKNRKPLEQLVKILEEYKIPHKVAVEEANSGRPISEKVAATMDLCGAAILIFTADEEFEDAQGNKLWRPSENVVYELGAAAAKYGSRIIIFKEEAVDFPTNFRDIGHISFEKDRLDAKGIDLFRELIAFELVTLSVSE
jgi:hypothetical protein